MDAKDDAAYQRAKFEVTRLVDKYQHLKESGHLKDQGESDTKKDFITPLFRILGWDVENDRTPDEVTNEDPASKGRVDYAFRINSVPKFLLEAKALNKGIDEAKDSKQAINYAWYKGVTWAVLTDFKDLYVYNAEVRENISEARFMWRGCGQFVDKFDDLWLLSKPAFIQGLLDKKAEDWGKKKRKVKPNDQLLEDITKFRELLSKNIKKNNLGMNLSPLDIDEAVQKILDRLIFIRSAEDRKFMDIRLLSAVREFEQKKRGKLTDALNAIYHSYDEKFDSKLFTQSNPKKPHLCETVHIDDDVLAVVVKGLYESPNGVVTYDFDLIDEDILGSMYEQYLAHILRTTEKRAQLEHKVAHRKEQGIYYTPASIVNYIVQNTLGECLKGKSAAEASKIRVLDPACGSGSFLTKSFKYLEKWHRENDPAYAKSYIEARNSGRKDTPHGAILQENIFGVDLDPRAVEIAQLSLLISAMDDKGRLPTLQENVKNGNSLIEDTAVAGDKAFVWEKEFSSIIKDGGFDVVVGNPPYEKSLYLEREKEYYSEKFTSAYGAYDILILFIEQGLKLLREEGYLGLIVSNKFLVSDYGQKIREYILANSKIIQIIDLSDAKRIFPDALVSPVIIILQKKKEKGKYTLKRFIAYKETTSFNETEFEKISIHNLVSENGTFSVRYDSKNEGLYSKIRGLPHFGDTFEIRTGVMGFEYWKMDPFIHEGKKSKGDIRIATNSYLDRYSWLWGKKINLYKKNYTEPYADANSLPISSQTKELFLKPNKIIVRGVAMRLTAALDAEGVGFLVAVHSVIPAPNYDSKVILALLNSKLFDWIHKERFYLGRIPEGSLKYPVSFLKELPLASINEIEQKRLIELADKIISFNKRLIELGDKQTSEREKLEKEIQETDKKIDDLVYDLYGLTQEERKIVEEAVK